MSLTAGQRLGPYEIVAPIGKGGMGEVYSARDTRLGRDVAIKVEGPTLAERIAEGPIPLEEALQLAAQIAQALEAAHEKGIVHRDLKPGNVKIKPDGVVRVLDFGLAKAGLVSGSGERSVENSPTMNNFDELERRAEAGVTR